MGLFLLGLTNLTDYVNIGAVKILEDNMNDKEITPFVWGSAIAIFVFCSLFTITAVLWKLAGIGG